MWGFGTISNKTDDYLLVDYAVPAGHDVQAGDLNHTRGNAIVVVGGLGAVYFTDVGHQPGGPHHWAVDLQFGESSARWWYDGGGVLDAVFEQDGSFTLSGQGQTIHGQITSPREVGAAAAPPKDTE
jgi:hypothetical protein